MWIDDKMYMIFSNMRIFQIDGNHFECNQHSPQIKYVGVLEKETEHRKGALHLNDVAKFLSNWEKINCFRIVYVRYFPIDSIAQIRYIYTYTYQIQVNMSQSCGVWV